MRCQYVECKHVRFLCKQHMYDLAKIEYDRLLAEFVVFLSRVLCDWLVNSCYTAKQYSFAGCNPFHPLDVSFWVV